MRLSMSKMIEIVDILEDRLTKLIINHENLVSENESLKESLQQLQLDLTQKNTEIEALKKQYESVKMSNSLLGSDENKRDTKLKINTLIREIDYCIAQLSD
jgi:chromosome segregation ATPase